ncbi:hypothetical protein HPB47_014447 [Ixodes persulcatus]|uniref:Uncharacterized protein n=1 Tax=Ixodes persulcatus TaxID=34615 RepID=A0AC60QZK8_IXOPE|nr:hypothetical protein HPB47_014447 [Ixodes persulcatus]
MELQRLLKSELLDLCEELGVEAGTSMKKMELVKAIQEEGLDNDEIEVMWKRIRNRNEDEAKFKELELEKLRLEVELRKTNGGPEMEVAGSRNLYDMSKLIQPFKVGQDMGLYLVNFERACERARFNRDSWPRRLLGVLPCEAAGVIARLTAEEADDYECVKGCLLKKYRLSAEAFRQKFRSVSKKSEASYAEFAYELRSYLIEWMKVAKSYDDKGKILEVVALEQFYKTLKKILREQGKSLGEGLVQVLTRAKARELSTRLAYDDASPGDLKDSPVRFSEQGSLKETRKGVEREKTPALDREIPDEQLTQTDGVLLAPTSKSFEQLVSVTKKVLIEEQRAVPSPTKLWETCKDGVAQKNVTFPVCEDVLYFDKLIFVIAGLVIVESVASLAGFVCCCLCFFGVLVTLDDLKADLFRRAAETPPLQRSSRPWRSCNERRPGDPQASKRPSKKQADVGKRPGISTFREPIGLQEAQGHASAARRKCWSATFQEARRHGPLLSGAPHPITFPSEEEAAAIMDARRAEPADPSGDKRTRLWDL